jgi:hypothetical protein
MAATLRTQATGYQTANATGVSVQAGDLIVVALREKDGNTMAVSDSVNGAYTRAVAAPISVGISEIWYFRNSAAGTLDFTVTGGSTRDYNVSVWHSVQTGSGVLDTTNGATNSATASITHGSITPSGSSLIITACVGGLSSPTPHSGFVALDLHASAEVNRQFYAYKVTHTGTINPTHTDGGTPTTDACCAAFLETGGGGGVVGPLTGGHLFGRGILGGRLIN